MTKNISNEFRFGWILDLGANIVFNDEIGLDFGIRYNVIPSLEKSMPGVVEYEEDAYKPAYGTSKINADYITFYIESHQNNNNKTDA